MKSMAPREAASFGPSSRVAEEYVLPTAPLAFIEDESAFVRSPLGIATLLWRNRRYLLKVAMLGLLASTIIAFLIPKKYQSSTSLMPPDTRSMSNAALASLAPEASDTFGTYASTMLGLKSSGALFISILQSRTVQNRIIEAFDLRRVYGQSRWQDARRTLTENTGIAEDRKSGVITIVVIDRDPHRAEAMAHTYLEELNRVVAERTTSAAHRERVFLEERLQTIKADLDSAARALSEFSSKNTALDISTQVKSMVEALATLEGQAIAARSELRGLEQIYTANNVRVHAAQARLGELEKQMAKLEGRKGQTPEDSDTSGATYPSIRELPLLAVTYADLSRRVKIQETVYQVLTRQYELAKVEEAKEIPSVRVLDPADLPEKKFSPRRSVIMGFGTFLSLAAAAALLIARSLWESIGSANPNKLFIGEVVGTVRNRSSRTVLRFGRLIQKAH
jgi:uncharacterized protein involved in exopolysaccharide biosynthesis